MHGFNTHTQTHTLCRGYPDPVLSALRQLDPDKINYDLAVAAVEWVVGHGEEGAILIFMPGLMEIRWAHVGQAFFCFGASARALPKAVALDTNEGPNTFPAPFPMRPLQPHAGGAAGQPLRAPSHT